MAWWVSVVVAVITAVVGPMLLLWRQHQHQLKVLRQENTDQHAEGRQLLAAIHGDLLEVHRDLGKIDERTEQVVEAVEGIRVWVSDHEVRHAVDGMRRDVST